MKKLLLICNKKKAEDNFKKYASDLNLELHHHGDLPARSGIGSSSAFAVGLIKALSAFMTSVFSFF